MSDVPSMKFKQVGSHGGVYPPLRAVVSAEYDDETLPPDQQTLKIVLECGDWSLHRGHSGKRVAKPTGRVRCELCGGRG